MVNTPSTMAPLGMPAPAFSLPAAAGKVNPAGKSVSLDDFKDAPALLVIFLCNHCPFVQHIEAHLGQTAHEYQKRGLAVVGISANDVEAYPDDTPDHIAEQAQRAGFGFPYLYDESQQVAKAYGAACTPDFFLFDRERKLVYRGQYDDSRPGNNKPVTGADLRAAIDAVLAGKPVAEKQVPSMGCNIKWKKGNEPNYFRH